MNPTISISRRRKGVVVNITALILLVFVFELINHETAISKIVGLSLIGIFLITVIASFIYIFGLSGVWKMSHQNMKNLDERQIQVVSNAIRISYSLFVIAVLVIIYGYALLQKGPIDVVIAAAFLYLAHILPASILAWTEREV